MDFTTPLKTNTLLSPEEMAKSTVIINDVTSGTSMAVPFGNIFANMTVTYEKKKKTKSSQKN